MDIRTNRILTEEFEKLKADLIKKYDELDMRASGHFTTSLEVEISGTKALLWGADYSEQLEHGRGPNSGQSGKRWDDPVGDIEQWLIDKGVAATVRDYVRDRSTSRMVEREVTRSTLAFLIARKIMREGWNRKNHGGVELISQVITPERIQSILEKIGDVYITEFTSEIINYLRAVA